MNKNAIEELKRQTGSKRGGVEMKNYEKYADKIKEYKDKDFCKDFVKPYILKSRGCTNTSCDQCKMLQTIWLLEDYKEPEIDWSKVEVDTPILVRDNDGDKWIRRYFAKHEGKFVYAWNSGRTSWSEGCMTGMTGWKQAKLAESEEE